MRRIVMPGSSGRGCRSIPFGTPITLMKTQREEDLLGPDIEVGEPFSEGQLFISPPDMLCQEIKRPLAV